MCESNENYMDICKFQLLMFLRLLLNKLLQKTFATNISANNMGILLRERKRIFF